MISQMYTLTFIDSPPQSCVVRVLFTYYDGMIIANEGARSSKEN